VRGGEWIRAGSSIGIPNIGISKRHREVPLSGVVEFKCFGEVGPSHLAPLDITYEKSATRRDTGLASLLFRVVNEL
jgi:hypothetical protein